MTLRNLAIWGVIIVVLIGLWTVLNKGGAANKPGAVETISYSQLLAKVDAGQIKTATVNGAKLEAADKGGKTFITHNPEQPGRPGQAAGGQGRRHQGQAAESQHPAGRSCSTRCRSCC